METKPTYDELEQRVKELEEKAVVLERSNELSIKNEEKYRNIFNNTQIGLFRSRISDGKILECNNRFAQIVGYQNREECIRDFVASQHYVDPGTRERMVALIKETGEVQNFEVRATRSDGSMIWVRYSGFLNREKSYIEGVLADITDRKQVEEAVKESERRLSESQRIAHIGSWELNLITNELYWSDETYRLFGLEPQQFEANYEAFLDNIHPDDRDLVNKAYSDSLKNKSPYQIVHRLLLKDKTVKYVNEMCETYYDDSGEPIRSVGTVQDITERKKAENELEQHRNNLESLVRKRTDELQVMVNAMAGREIRMAELKKVIETLRTQMEEAGLTPVADDPLKETGKDYT